MNGYLLWGFITIFFTLAGCKGNVKLHGENVKKVEIELDFIEGNALITYNDLWKTKAKISYAEKKKVVAYRDEENGFCLLEKITKRKNGDGELLSRVYSTSDGFLDKVKTEKLAGKNVLNFCGKHPIALLKKYSREVDGKGEITHKRRGKRESDVIRGKESHLSHQEVSKKLLDDLAHAEALISGGKGVKRNVDGGMGHHPSASSKVGKPATVDYHARITNNLQPGQHPMHPIDITSSVTIATGASHPVWSYPPSAPSLYPQNITHVQGMSPSHGLSHHSLLSPHQNHSQSHHRGLHSQTLHQGNSPHPSASGQSFDNSDYYPPSSASKPHQNTGQYSLSSSGQPHQHSSQYPPTSGDKIQQHTGQYSPSPGSQPHQNAGQFSPSSSGQSHQHAAQYPPSSAGKTQQHIGQYSPPPSQSSGGQPHQHTAQYPPSSAGKTQQHIGQYSPPSSQSSGGQPHQHTAQYPPSSAGKTQQHIGQYSPPSSQSSGGQPHQHTAQYPPSSAGKTQQHTGQNSPSSAGKTQQHTANYPPSSAGHPHQNTGQYPPSSYGKSHLNTAKYPPSSTSKSQRIPGNFPDHEQGPGHYPPSSQSQVSQQGPGYYPPSSFSKPQHNATSGHGLHSSYGGKAPGQYPQGFQPSYVPPSSASKPHYTLPQSPNTSHHGGTEPEREVYAPRYPQSSTGKVYHQQGKSGIAQYPPSSTSKVYPISNNHGGSQGHAQYQPYPGSLYAPQYPPSSAGKVYYSPGSRESPYGHTPVLERPSARGNEPGGYPPSSTSKVHYSPHSHVMPAGGNAQSPQYYPPSSSSKVNYYPSSLPHSQYPPSSSGKPHYSHSSSNGLPAQIPQPPTERSHISGFPPSSTSKLHPQHYLTSSKADGSQHHQQPGYYPPSSTSKLHQSNAQNNFSSAKSPAYYPPSSTSKLHHHQDGGRVTASGRVSVTPGFGHQQQNNFGQQGLSSGHPVQQHPYYGPSSSSHQQNGSDPSGQGLYPQHQYPPSSSAKIHPSQYQNGTGGYYGAQIKPSYPMEQHPGGQHYPQLHNDSAQGSYYPPSGHHPSHGLYVPQYPPSSQQNQGGNQPQFYQSPSGQESQRSIRPCANSPRSLYSITTRTILTPNGPVQRPVSVKTNGEYPCGQLPGRYAPCSGTLTRNSQTVKPCAGNGNLRKSMNPVPGPALTPDRNAPQHGQHQRGFGNSGSGGVVISNVETQTELLHGIGYHHGSQFSKLKAAENSTDAASEDTTAPETFEEKSRKDVEVFEGEDEKDKAEGKPVKYEEESKTEETNLGSEEEVKEGDVLEPGDRILGKDGYTISDGFRGRVVAVTGQVGKKRAESRVETEKKSNSGQFRYSADLGRYVKETSEKNYSSCQGEPTFTCSEFLGSNGRAKICKPNPRRNPDGTPC